MKISQDLKKNFFLMVLKQWLLPCLDALKLIFMLKELLFLLAVFLLLVT